MKDNTNSVTAPAYYHNGGIDVIQYLELKASTDEVRGFLRGNIFKYVTRYRDKNGVEDLQKARSYIDKLIELEEKQ